MWAIKSARMGYRWKVGNGRRVRFWEDNWLGPSSLAVQFWPIYRVVVEKGKTIADLWDGSNLKCTFGRTFSEEMYRSWLDIVEPAATISLSNEEDSLIFSVFL